MNNKIALTFNKSILVSALLLEINLNLAHANTINVDGVNCSLANAITSANTDSAHGGCTAGNNSDTLELTTNGTFELNSPLPNIISNITINGNNSTISRSSNASFNASLLSIDAAPLINTNTDIRLTINDTTITKGVNTQNYGAGIYVNNGASLTLNNCTLSNNIGGALSITGSPDTHINHSTIINNQSSPVSYGYSGGINISVSTVTISNSTIKNNTAMSTFGSGGGVYVTNYLGSNNVIIENSTISGNSSQFLGAGIAQINKTAESYTNSLVIKNSTISNNSSIVRTGGVFLDSKTSAVFENVTITANNSSETGGMEINGATLSLKQSIISGNTTDNGVAEVKVTSGIINNDFHNIFGFNNTSGTQGFTLGASNIIPTVALASVINPTLALNGGTTMTHDLPTGSPAIDAITVGDCLNPKDQVGTDRAIDGDNDGTNGCDIGALEHIFVDLIFKNSFE